MASTSNSSLMRLQKVESELTVQFEIDNLQACFNRIPATKSTEHFGPGLRFGYHAFAEDNGPCHVGLYLYTSQKYPAMTINWTVSTKSLTGQLYQAKSMSYSFKCGEAIGWSKFLTAETYSSNATMKSENAILVHATLRFSPLWPIVFRPTLDILHRTVLGKSPHNVRFIAYTRRDSNGRLSSPRSLFVTKEAMTQRSSLFDTCKLLHPLR